jgi:hypothetical protein
MANTANLRPFVKGDARASELGRAGVVAREAKRAARVGDAPAMAVELGRVCSAFKREELGEQAAAVAGYLLASVASGRIVVKGPDVAALLRVLVDVARLEAGEHTSAALVGHLSGGAALERVAVLRQQAREALGSPDLSTSETRSTCREVAVSAAVVAVADVDAFGSVVAAPSSSATPPT